ncbi:MAG: hypothetical protein ACLUEK_05275 [Oscillospiraceae bacterium]
MTPPTRSSKSSPQRRCQDRHRRHGLRRSDLDVTVNALIGSMLMNGYLTTSAPPSSSPSPSMHGKPRACNNGSAT